MSRVNLGAKPYTTPQPVWIIATYDENGIANAMNAATCILKAEIVNVSVDESVLTDGKVDLLKVQPIAFDPFTNSYNVIGEKVGDAWGAGKIFMG